MGYSTKFKGTLTFKNDVSVFALQKLHSILGEDCRDHPEWNEFGGNELTNVDLKLTDDFVGLEWNGSEKSDDMVEKVNLITMIMRRDYPNFCLEGEFLAEGEDREDIWILRMNNGIAERAEFTVDYSKYDSERKCWLVVEDGYEYNDEYYYQPDCDGYSLVENRLFTEREAQELVDKKNKNVPDYFTDNEDNQIRPFKKIKIKL